MPIVSVIIPVYNVEKYLEECVASVLTQTFTDFELILVDDGSTDSSSMLCDQMATQDARIRVVHTENAGLSVTRNRGIELAKGEWVCFLDSDDALNKYALEYLYAMIREDSELDMAIASFGYKESILNKSLKPQHHKIIEPFEVIEDSLYQKSILNSACGKLFRKTLFESLSFTPGILYEDLDFFYQACLKCQKIVCSSAPIYFYRQHKGSIVHTWNNRRLDVLRVTEQIEEYMSVNNPDLLPAAMDRRLSANFNMFALGAANGNADVCKKTWDVIKSHRYRSLVNPHVRLKNKLGILASYLGKQVLYYICKMN